MATNEGEFPEDFQKLWCIEFSKSTTTKIFLVDCFAHPEIYDRDDAAVLLISRTLYTGPGPRYCRLDTIEEVEPESKSSSPVYVVHGICPQTKLLPVWTHFKVRIIDGENENDDILIIEPLPEG